MFSLSHFRGLPAVHLFSIKTNCLLPRGLSARGVLLALVCWMVLLSLSSRAWAGCHFSDGRSFAQAKHSENPREHARNFRFLGQWVYEQGEIRYVPWRAGQACDGPNCHSEKPEPVSTIAPLSSVHRLPTVVLLISGSHNFGFESQVEWLCHDDGEPLCGFAFELEHPPKVA